MALKHKIDKKAYDKLDKLLQAEYKEDGEGYVLDVDGLEDTGALKRAKEHEVEKRKEALAEIKKLKEDIANVSTELEELRDAKAKGGDAVAATEKAWKEKLAKREKELTDAQASLQTALEKQMVESVATTVSSELAGENSELLMPHIQRRLRAQYKDGKVSTSVLGPDGETSAMTVDELKKEVLASGKFAAVVIASKGSGAGGSGPRKGAGGTNPPKKLSEMTATEEAKFAREHPEEYQKFVAAEPVTYRPQPAAAKIG